jgi:target of rapamycin complex 2 subunit MAPKAP1
MFNSRVGDRRADYMKIVIYKATETKRYDFEAKSADEAAEIVFEIKKGISPYHNI